MGMILFVLTNAMGIRGVRVSRCAYAHAHLCIHFWKGGNVEFTPHKLIYHKDSNTCTDIPAGAHIYIKFTFIYNVVHTHSQKRVHVQLHANFPVHLDIIIHKCIYTPKHSYTVHIMFPHNHMQSYTYFHVQIISNEYSPKKSVINTLKMVSRTQRSGLTH